MKTKQPILVLAALLGSAALATADHPPRPDGGGARGGDKTFGNGALPEFLQMYDLDENGILDEEEIQAAKAARNERAAERRASFDLDGDGELSAAERHAARGELRAKIEERRCARFIEADGGEGGDGELTFEEFSAIGAIARLVERNAEAAQRIFARLDADGNGTVSKAEFIAHLGHRRPHGGDRPGGDGGGGGGGGEGEGGE